METGGDSMVTRRKGAAGASRESPLAGRLANASVALAILSGCLFSLAALFVWIPGSLQWRPPFVWTLVPRTYLPLFSVSAATLGVALGAIVAGLAAFVASIVKGRHASGMRGVCWRALFGAAIGCLVAILIGLPMFGFLHKWRHINDAVACGQNLRRLDGLLREYVRNNRGKFPPLSSQPGVLMFAPEAIPLEGDDVGLFTCPTARYAEKGTAAYNAAHMTTPPFGDQSYFYLGYAVLDDDDVEAFARAYRKRVSAGGTFDEDLVVDDGEGTRILHRLQPDAKYVWEQTQDPNAVSPYEGHEGYGEIPDFGGITSDVPILIERGIGHVYTDWDKRPRYSHVLYAQEGLRTVERGTWPITEKTLSILEKLAE